MDFVPNNDYGPDLWPSFIDASTPNIADDHQCATICLLVGACDLFFTDTGTSTCYTGKFSVLDGTVLAAPVNGPFHQVQARYGKMKKKLAVLLHFNLAFFFLKDLLVTTEVATKYDDYPGLERWHDHILATPIASYPTEDECALACLARTADCSYYVYGAGGDAASCSLGSFDLDKASSALSPGSEAVTVKVVNGKAVMVTRNCVCIRTAWQPCSPLADFSRQTDVAGNIQDFVESDSQKFHATNTYWDRMVYATYGPPASGSFPTAACQVIFFLGGANIYEFQFA